jgi:transposase InsO family protein
LDSRSIFEMMRLSEKRRAPRRNKLRIHLGFEQTFPLWTPSSATPELLVASTVFLGNGLAALLERVGMSAVIPKRLLELRDIAQQVKAKKWKCSMKTAVLARGAFAAQKPLGEWMVFVRRTGLRADYVVDTPTAREKIAMFDHAMRDKRLYARDDAWTGLHGAVLKSCAGESRYDWVC